jgi:hypothetical protein
VEKPGSPVCISADLDKRARRHFSRVAARSFLLPQVSLRVAPVRRLTVLIGASRLWIAHVRSFLAGQAEQRGYEVSTSKSSRPRWAPSPASNPAWARKDGSLYCS